MNKGEILYEYRKIVGSDSQKARDLIKKLDYKQNYYLLQCIAQTYLDECRFKDDGHSTMRLFINKRKWRMAERYIIKAFTANPESADVLYTMGGVRKTNSQTDIAIYCFEKIIKLGIRKIAYGEYGRGVQFAKELINDSKFELYRLFHDKDKKKSEKYLSMYKKGLEVGTNTIYKPIKRFLLKKAGN